MSTALSIPLASGEHIKDAEEMAIQSSILNHGKHHDPYGLGAGIRRSRRAPLEWSPAKRMHVFSSMGSEDIIVGATSKRGVRALRDFLSYCETGILHETERETGRGPDSDFEVAVMNALRDEGFECIPQVGVAGFFIDVAVVDPGNPGRYLMGIECDGATYHSAKSARDRDRLRQAILERLGWNIRRIWSTDWYKNPHGELRPIIRELHRLKSTARPADIPPADNNTIDAKDRIDDAIREDAVKNAKAGRLVFEETKL